MKILIPTHPNTNTGYPRIQGRGGGGLETAMEKMIEVLVDEGHEVDLLTPDDYPIEDDRIGHIEPGFLSKKQAGRASWKVWTEAWLSVADMYDRVLLNDALLTLSPETLPVLRSVAPKIRAVYHLYDEQIDGSFMTKQIQVLSEIKQHGGRVSCVSPTLNDYIRRKYPDGKLGNNPYLSDLLTLDVTDLEFERFTVGIALDTQPITDSNGDFVFIGRGVKEKNLKVALQAFVKADTGDRLFHVFTTEPNGANSQEYWEECMRKYILGPNIVPHIDAPRSEIMDVLSKSSVMVFPSLRESFGIVPLEGSSYGLNIIHKDERAGCYRSEDHRLTKITSRTLAYAMETVSVPSLEEKQDRAGWTKEVFSEERYKANLKSFVL